MSFPRTTALAKAIEQGEALRPLPVDSIIAQLKHLQENANQPSQATLAKLTIRRQLAIEWEGAEGPAAKWVDEVGDVVQDYYDWVLRHDTQRPMETEPRRKTPSGSPN